MMLNYYPDMGWGSTQNKSKKKMFSALKEDNSMEEITAKQLMNVYRLAERKAEKC